MVPMRRQRGEEAAAAVEFAILAPLIFMLIFGMLHGALAWNSKQALSHAAREAARYGATLPTDEPNWLDTLAQRAVNSAEGQLGTAPGDSYSAYGRTFNTYVCVAYVNDASTFSDSWGSADGVTAPAANAPCFDDGRPIDEARVQVHVAREQLFQAVVITPDITLQSVAVTRHEILE